MVLTGKPDSVDPLTFVEAAHICVQESKQLHNSLNTWPSKTLERERGREWKPISGIC
jgi:hypothetical protein